MSAIIYAISGTELFFTAVKSLLLGANRACLKALAVVSFLIESVAGMALTVLLLTDSWDAGAHIRWAIRAGVTIFVITEVLSILTEGHSIYSKLSGKNEDGGRGGGGRRTVVKWFGLTSGLASLIFALSEYHPYFSRNYNYNRDVVVEEMVLAVVLVQMLVIGLGSLLWWGKFVLRISIALVIFVVDLGFGVLVLASDRAGRTQFSEAESAYEFSRHVGVSVFVLALASALTAASAFGLVGYKARGEVANDQVQFIETLVLSSVGPFMVMALAETSRENVVPVLVTILPQMAVHLGPLLFEYLKAMLRAIR